MVFGSKAPALTEANVGDQSGKVFIVTGATSGYGLLLSTFLYQNNGTVYLAARNATKTASVIADLKSRFPTSKGKLDSIPLNLSDLSTIKASAAEFLSKESQLHVLFNNAGVMFPPAGSTTNQGYELQLGTNNVGPHLFTKLLYPTLVETAKTAPRASVRVVWVSSDAAGWAPKPAIDFGNLDYRRAENDRVKYGRSKAGTVMQAVELARRARAEGSGVLSISLDPGIANTGLQRDMGRFMAAAVKLIANKPEVGAYTQLFAGLSGDITPEVCEKEWVVPPGKIGCPRRDLFTDLETARKWWEWNEEQVKEFI
ncbi:uncharacterized protein DSM5745_03628 [Aspergillus mulundensis]|uniref:Short-chain dehydrogenase n=1 Tax=Aspergillus mulundensis TaxID=1810919 RepID=A0A3D8SL31_9EURO|nr:Uncharacterized protein DSM5745_03628 [Aspergillus mulundensis]RDW86986.1 Uncharacterized protein DSM5745_03628 [Aspergillus mulundensis]